MQLTPIVTHQVVAIVNDLNAAYARCIDDNEIEGWPDFFTEKGIYRITTRENELLGLPMPVLSLEGRAMIRDRVVALRNANLYNLHADLHIIGCGHVDSCADGIVQATTPFAIYQTDQDGVSRLFVVGTYHDEIVINNDSALLRYKNVVLTTSLISNLLATPL
ncbi:aromatic-ring-hydroxylating dioxygenase subunit beta [Burkholderia sp. BCC1988]|uniref:aromatic-ring-hydroxylating dioxygenase subunit beta n=1 Tax=Burkholderia sp. BCC1988 TaxID=2817443 RepID=UPI0039F084CE